MKGRITNIGHGLEGDLTVTLSLPRHNADNIKKLLDADIDAEIKKWREKRSHDANSLCWALCRDIAAALKAQHTDVEVYRRAIRDVGEYEHLPIKEVAVETFTRRWESKGIGWFVDVVDDSKLSGYKLVKAFYGSSTYTTKEMSTLLDYLVDEAEQMGLTIITKKYDVEKAKKEWGGGV